MSMVGLGAELRNTNIIYATNRHGAELWNNDIIMPMAGQDAG